MTLPYKFRIMARLGTDDPVELMRANRLYQQSDWNHCTRDLSPEWVCWVEQPIPDRNTITPRVGAVSRAPGRLRLSRTERTRLRDFATSEFNP